MSVHDDQALYDVGFAKPPTKNQFRKGTSGNPKGRPKGAKNLATVLERILRERVVISEHGARKTVTKLEAAMKQLANKAAGGDIVAIRQLIAFAASAGLEAENIDTKDQVSGSDLKLMNRLIERLQKSGKG